MITPTLSIVVPTYNCFDKMRESLSSLERIAQLVALQLVIVDDRSNDMTYEHLQEWVDSRPYAQLTQLAANSGSAAAPRNAGIELADAPYVYFHDADDVLLPEGLAAALNRALASGADVVRGPLVVREGNSGERLSDDIPEWESLKTDTEKLRAIVRRQSLTCSSIFRRALLREHQISFDPGRRIGEDIVFTARALVAARSVRFERQPLRIYVKSHEPRTASVTQRITSADFGDFVRSWEDVENILDLRGISFVREHGLASIQYAVRQYIWFGTEPLTESDFRQFSDFCLKHWSAISTMRFADRVSDVLVHARRGDHASFTRETRLRLVVAGHDLKFMSTVLPALEKRCIVRTDLWGGHNVHDEHVSKEMVAWADIVWAEWLLGASVWYSEQLTPQQRLIIRAHRSEMVTDYGDRVRWDRVHAVVTIAPHTLSAFRDRFDIPNEKMWLLPNSFDCPSYRVDDERRSHSTIGMIGAVPRLKGFRRALRVLAKVRQSVPEAELHVFGRRPEELEWLMRDPAERAYFEGCRTFIEEAELMGAVVYRGWVDTKHALTEVSLVVSSSDYEGMQVAVGDAFCAGAVALILPWEGARECYPSEFVVSDERVMAERIVEYMGNEGLRRQHAMQGREWIQDRYHAQRTEEEIERLLSEIRT
ncbi:glycosyltransferase [Tessaracoccus lapidicaptus]|uniref:glycosyltransferase n=1 Tax=Tessaracoccus lapidicaptus TaxID=1427523 RepID=UPI0033423DDE